MRILYISEGDVPSRFAHATQAMDMASALARSASDLTLLTAGTLTSTVPSDGIFAWYGKDPTFRIVKIPVAWSDLPFLDGKERKDSTRHSKGWKNHFVTAASMVAFWQQPDLIFTRCCRVARYTTSLGSACLCREPRNVFQ